MYIQHIKIQGFKTLSTFETSLNKNLNIIVGDNEAGKTTLLEAINLVISCQINGRNIYHELDPYWFNDEIVKDYYTAVCRGDNIAPPKILIEAYLDDEGSGELAKLKGTNNTRGEDCAGLYLAIELDEDLADDFSSYIKSHNTPSLVPIEYYKVTWRSFADNAVTSRSIPFCATAIDTSLTRGNYGPNKYLAQILNECLQKDHRISLAVAYRKLRSTFMNEKGIEKINDYLAGKKGDITAKTLTVSLDMSARATWDSSITAHLEDIPFDDVGKGEQCRVQMKLAIEAADKCNVLLIEEPENHLSHTNMFQLIDEISRKCDRKQIVITTHSSFVLNKLGIENVKLISPSETMTLGDLSPDTNGYFMKLPGYDTLRLLLAKKTILVEGPSDELIVQKAYSLKFKKPPLADRVDVISVGSLAFKRFLEIGAKLKLDVRVVTDNDGDIGALRNRYKDYIDDQYPSIKICYDPDVKYPSLEQQLLKANSLKILNRLLNKDFNDGSALIEHMQKHKTDCALGLFTSNEPFTIPRYIQRAIE